MNKTVIHATELSPLELYEALRASFDALYIEEGQQAQQEEVIKPEKAAHFPLFLRHAALQK